MTKNSKDASLQSTKLALWKLDLHEVVDLADTVVAMAVDEGNTNLPRLA